MRLYETSIASHSSAGCENFLYYFKIYEREIAMLDRHLRRQLKDDRGYRAITKLPGVGKVIAAGVGRHP